MLINAVLYRITFLHCSDNLNNLTQGQWWRQHFHSEHKLLLEISSIKVQTDV